MKVSLTQLSQPLHYIYATKGKGCPEFKTTVFVRNDNLFLLNSINFKRSERLQTTFCLILYHILELQIQALKLLFAINFIKPAKLENPSTG